MFGWLYVNITAYVPQIQDMQVSWQIILKMKICYYVLAFRTRYSNIKN